MIDTNENDSFETLARAPIIEAVIQWRAQPIESIDPDKLNKYLSSQLIDYSSFKTEHELVIEHQIESGQANVKQTHGWRAIRVTSNDGRYVVHFGRNGLTVSRLAPYTNWNDFQNEAFRLWRCYRGFLNPPETQILTLRFINLIGIDTLEEIEKFLEPGGAPSIPANFPFHIDKFIHQTSFGITGYDYRLNLIQSVKTASPNSKFKLKLVVDIDVSVSTPMDSLDDQLMEQRLAEMRWIKNKAFFSVFSAAGIDEFRG